MPADTWAARKARELADENNDKNQFADPWRDVIERAIRETVEHCASLACEGDARCIRALIEPTGERP